MIAKSLNVVNSCIRISLELKLYQKFIYPLLKEFASFQLIFFNFPYSSSFISDMMYGSATAVETPIA